MDADFDAINVSIGDIAKRDMQYAPGAVLPIFNIDDNPALCVQKIFSEWVTSLQATEGLIKKHGDTGINILGA